MEETKANKEAMTRNFILFYPTFDSYLLYSVLFSILYQIPFHSLLFFSIFFNILYSFLYYFLFCTIFYSILHSIPFFSFLFYFLYYSAFFSILFYTLFYFHVIKVVSHICCQRKFPGLRCNDHANSLIAFVLLGQRRERER